MFPSYVKVGVALGVVLVCIGIALNYLPIVRPMVIDPGPSVKSIIASGFFWTGWNVIIISMIFLLRFEIRNQREALQLDAV